MTYKNQMKKGRIITAFLAVFLLTGVLSGCAGGISAAAYLKKQITELKQEEEAILKLFDEEFSLMGEKYSIKFPNELKKPYGDFLREALKQVEFHVERAKGTKKKKRGRVFEAKIYFEPLDLKNALSAANDEYFENLETDDFLQCETELLKKDVELIKKSAKKPKTYVSVALIREEGNFRLEKEALLKLVKAALPGCMEIYESGAGLFEARDFLKAALDAYMKGEPKELSLQSGISEKEILEKYNREFDVTFLTDTGRQERCKAAVQEIVKKNRYTVGIPRKSKEGGYTVEVTATPNVSFERIYQELQNGTYYSEAEVEERLVSLCEKYAASPAYADEKHLTVHLNLRTIAEDFSKDSEFGRLAFSIMPVPTENVE